MTDNTTPDDKRYAVTVCADCCAHNCTGHLADEAVEWYGRRINELEGLTDVETFVVGGVAQIGNQIPAELLTPDYDITGPTMSYRT